MQAATSLTTLPVDIIYEICGHLSDPDFLNLRLVSIILSPKLPVSRFDRILSRWTLSFTDVDTLKLKRLASTASPALLARLKHLVFELRNPYWTLYQAAQMSSRATCEYDKSTQIKILQFCHNYRDKKPQRKSANRFKKLAAKIFSGSSDIDSKPPSEPVDTFPLVYSQPGSEPTLRKEDIEYNTFYPFFNIIYDNVKCADLKFDREAFLKSLTDVLKLLPDLRIIEFTYMSTAHQPGNVRKEFSSYWRKYNPSLQAFLSNTPGLEELPWWDSFSEVGSKYSFSIAYPTVLSCAALAGCRISEVRANKIYRGEMDEDVETSIRNFDSIYYEDPWTTPPVPRLAVENYEAATIDKYKYTFENLIRLEIRLNGREPHTTGQKSKISPLFLATIQNVQELRMENSGHSRPFFMVPTDLVLPKLRKLEIVRSRIQINNLLDFVRTNNSSLKELICTLTFDLCTTKGAIITLLTDLREILDLEVCRIDYLTSRSKDTSCYSSIDVRGWSWRNDTSCKYRVGSKCTVREYLHSLDPLEGTYWMEQGSWEEFMVGIEEMGTLEPCPNHWDGKYKYT